MYVDTKEAIAVTLEPSLRNLAYVLRHKEMWPKGFEWNYPNFTGCAMGLSEELWNKSVYSEYLDEVDRKIFIRPVSLFRHPLTGFNGRMQMVTPEIVADRIEKYLEAA